MTTTSLPVARWDLRGGQDADPLRFLDQLSASPADVVPFAVGRHAAFLLNHPDRIEEVFVRRAAEFDKGSGFARVKGLLGNGLLTADRDLHRERRRISQRAFQRQQLEAYAPLIATEAAARVSTWPAGVPIDLARQLRTITLAVAGTCLFGDSLEPWQETIARAVSGAVSPMDGLRAAIAPPAAVRRARRELDAVIDAIIAARQQEPTPGRDLLSLLLEASADGGNRATAMLRDDILTFLIAGHDTVSHALTWSLLLLAQHPTVDEQLQREIAALPENGDIVAGDVARCVYARAVVAESLRLFPPAWVLVRRAATATVVGTDPIPADSLLIASPYAMHRAARYYPEPLRFLPERWLSPDPARPRLAFLPFGAGPRACIGEGFAWLEAVLVLVTVARRWRLATTGGTPLEGVARMTLRPATATVVATRR